MNKQAITFLSLFSLILVLSIYYVMLPPVDNSAAEMEIVNSNSASYTFEKMEVELQAKRDAELKEYNEVIAASDSSSEEVSNALQEVQNIKDKSSLESEIKNLLVNSGYESVFVEIDGSIIKITIALVNPTSKDATDVINLVLSKTTELTPEVKFVNE